MRNVLQRPRAVPAALKNSHGPGIFTCDSEADQFLGMVPIEDLLFAAAGATVESLMDR